MVYVVSNLHGNYTKFKQLLKTIAFKETDLMYVLGDIVDYGDESMELIGDLSVRYNVYPIVGEHDYIALKMLSGFNEMLKSGETPDKKFIMNNRTLIEQSLLRYYPDEVRKICTAVNVAGANHNVRQSNLAKKATSATLINAYIQALWNISGKNIPLNEYSKFKYTVSLNMEETEIENVINKCGKAEDLLEKYGIADFTELENKLKDYDLKNLEERETISCVKCGAKLSRK